MSLENLKEALPEFAKDLKLNLGSIARITSLTEQQLWGTALACAAATRSKRVLAEVSAEAGEHLGEEATRAALGAASVMAMNNVFYRARHFLGGDYEQMRAGLRMNIIGNPGVEKADFELWSLAVSTINGCEACVTSHEHSVIAEGLSKEQVFDAVRIAAIVQGVAQALLIQATLDD